MRIEIISDFFGFLTTQKKTSFIFNKRGFFWDLKISYFMTVTTNKQFYQRQKF